MNHKVVKRDRNINHSETSYKHDSCMREALKAPYRSIKSEHPLRYANPAFFALGRMSAF